MSSPAPIIFVNRGNSSHLFLACAQARRTQPRREVILLGDRSTAHYRWMLGVRHVDFSLLEKSSQRLRASFQNDSSNPSEFEFFCLQRWFILHEFLAGQGSGARCIYLDSDILVYGDLSVPEADFLHYGMTFQACSGHASFINSPLVLGEFVQFILEHYENPVRNQALRNRTASIRQTAPAWNVSDMSFFLMFHEQHPKKMVDLHFPMKDSYALDQTIDSDFGGFEMEHGIKKIAWQNGLPCCRHLPTGRLIQFYTLHFQGKSKRIMRDYLKTDARGSRLAYLLNQVFLWCARLLARLRRRDPKLLAFMRSKPAIWVKTLRQFSFLEAIALIRQRARGVLPVGKAQDNFVAADTFSFVFNTGGQSARLGNRNLLVLPRYRRRENVRMLLRRHTTDFHIFNQVFRSQEYEPILALTEAGGLSGSIRIIDAGSNVGCSPIWWLCCFPGAQVVAIEPDPDNFHLAEENIRLNDATGSVTALRRALWSSAEELSVTQDFRDGREYAFSVRPASESDSQQRVEGITIPEIMNLRGWSGVDILKVDIEGGERVLFEDINQAEINLRQVSILALEIHDDVANRQKIELNLRQLGFQLSHQHETLFASRQRRRQAAAIPMEISK